MGKYSIAGIHYCVHCGGPLTKNADYRWRGGACSLECLDAHAILNRKELANCVGCGKSIAAGFDRIYCTRSCREQYTQRRGGITVELRRKVYAKTGGRCAYCGDRAEHVDHIIPFSKGGPTTIENLAPACVSCNLTAHDYLADNFEAKRQYILRKRGPLPDLRSPAEPEETFERPKWHRFVYGGVKRKGRP